MRLLDNSSIAVDRSMIAAPGSQDDLKNWVYASWIQGVVGLWV